MAEVTDHDLLIRIDQRTEDMGKKLDNHLAHHTLYTLGAWGAALAAIGALLVSLITK